MAELQTAGARQLLSLIAKRYPKGQTLTYTTAAGLMGRGSNHARAVAQMCDLLDAAACYAGVPLLALVAILSHSTGGFNPRAWKEEPEDRRQAIFDRSAKHKFSSADFKAISRALTDLGNRGNRLAWNHLHCLYPGDLLYRRLISDYSNPYSDAINDIGSDAPEPLSVTTTYYPRDPAVRTFVMKRANGKCELCGGSGFLKPDKTRYLETHHIIALANQGADKVTNVIALCPKDHREAHYGERAKELEKEMMKRLRTVNSKDNGAK